MLADSHCHIHEPDYDLPAEGVLKAAAEANVRRIITLSGEMSDLQLALDYAKRYHDSYGLKVYACLGVHPQEASNLPDDFIDQIRRLIEPNCDVVCGVGEIGLDYYYDFASHELQIKALKAQLELAHELNLPVSMHIRSGDGGNAFDNLMATLEQLPFKIHGVVHSFTDTTESLYRVLNYGLYVGVNGIATFNKDPELAAAYDQMPLERILLETDSPWLTPKPYRGQTNQPARIKDIAAAIAARRGLTLDEVAKQTTSNTIALYGLAP